MQKQNIESMLFQCWASVADSDTTLNQQRGKSMCVLGTLNAILFDKQIYIYLKVQILSGHFWKLKSEVRSLKSKIPAQNGCQKTHTRNSNQSVIKKLPSKI